MMASSTETITFLCIAFAVQITHNPSEVYKIYAGCKTSVWCTLRLCKAFSNIKRSEMPKGNGYGGEVYV